MKILLADDHVLVQTMTVRLLQAEGHEVSVAETGLQAIDACRDQSFDVVFMDLQLPVMDGVSAIQRIRALENESKQFANKKLVIWALTADSSSQIKTACLEAGADGLLTKPLRPNQLQECLHTIGSAGSEQQTDSVTHNSSKPNSSSSASMASGLVLMDTVGQDIESAQSLVALFQRDYKSLLNRFQLAFETQDFQTVLREAHSLKSPARIFGAANLHSLCDELENISRDNNADELRAIQPRFMDELLNLHDVVTNINFS